MFSIDLVLWGFAKRLLPGKKRLFTGVTKVIYWIIPTVLFPSLFYALLVVNETHNYHSTAFLIGIFMMLYTPKMVFVLFYASRNCLQWIKKGSISSQHKARHLAKGERMNRLHFLEKIGLLAAAVPLTTISYGMFKGRFNFKVYRSTVRFDRLPKGLCGLKIVQLSDIHLSHFNAAYDILDGVVERINALHPDLVFMTGDLVNNFASETEGWEKVFSRIKAKHGQFAVLGNHDYGDYSKWSCSRSKRINFEQIKQAYRKLGFQLLLNSNKTLELNGEKLVLIGVENWGHPPFPRYGDLKKAMQGPLPGFKILLSHDPDHWEAEVKTHTDIDLCLSGHTHGMQTGVSINKQQWSPAQWKYKHWGGLYRSGQQYLYVNRGLGVVGIPMRTGMPPEITLIELDRT